MIPRWLVLSAVGVLAILLFVFAAREVPVLAVLAIVGAGLAGLGHLVTRNRKMPALPAEEERAKRDNVLREVPPSHGGPGGVV